MSVGVVGGLSITTSSRAAPVRGSTALAPRVVRRPRRSTGGGTDVRLAARLHGRHPLSRGYCGRRIDLTCCTTVPDVPRVWILSSTRGGVWYRIEPSDGLEFDTGSPTRSRPSLRRQPSLRACWEFLYCAPDEIPRLDPTVHIGVESRSATGPAAGDDYWHAVTRVAVACSCRAGCSCGRGRRSPRGHGSWRAAWSSRCGAARRRRDVPVDADGARWVIADSQVDVRDTTGAGDSSAGAIVAAVSAGADSRPPRHSREAPHASCSSDWGIPPSPVPTR